MFTVQLDLQIAELPNLAQLTLNECKHTKQSVNTLSRLSSSLTRLRIEACHMPDTLSRLTRLKSLSLLTDADADEFPSRFRAELFAVPFADRIAELRRRRPGLHVRLPDSPDKKMLDLIRV